ncbi:MAG: hypothetical protein HFJ17_00040 [Clostridia bacterium]|nr:hypothetical protein [Clostridia bacterium]
MVKPKKILAIIIPISIVVLIFLLSIIFAIINMNSTSILKGISINGIDVSKMTKEEATLTLSKLVEEKGKEKLKIYYSGENKDLENNETSNETNIEISSLDVKYNINEAVSEAYNEGRTGNIFQNNYTILRHLITGKNIKLNVSINENNLAELVKDVSSNIPNKLIQSSYYIEDGQLIITSGENGNILKEESFKEEMQKVLCDLSKKNQDIIVPMEESKPKAIDIDLIHKEIYKEPKDAYYEKNPFKIYKDIEGVDFDVEEAKELIANKPDKSEYKIKLKYTKANIKLNDLDIDIFPDLLASFTTRYDERNEDRTNNLKLAVSKINNTILAPGEEFSYNKVVGKRSIAAGYKEAKIYTNGRVEDGLGGGICQISSTLYNAVVFANLNVTERHNHQFVTSYVEPGRDATVVYGAKDLKFVNSRTYPIKIKMSINSGIAKVEIFGIKEETEFKINFDTEIVSSVRFATKYEEDSSLKEGEEKVKQKGSNGLVVKAYKVVRKDGVVVSRDLISQDTYKALNKIIVKNP